MNDRPVDEARNFLAAWPDARAVELLLPDLNGILRGKRIGRRELQSLWRDGITFPATGILLDSRGALIEGLSYGSDDGDPDYVCRPVPGSLVPVPWAKTQAGQCLVTLEHRDGRPFFADCMQVLAGAEHLWLPRRVREIEVDGGKLRNGIGHAAYWLRWTEKWISPRRGPQWLLTHLRPVAGLPVLILALIIAIPIPFGNIVPCVALLFFALGLIAEDGLALAAGLALGFVAVAWTVFLFVAGGNLAGSALSMAGLH